jgi:hypothetical protein
VQDPRTYYSTDSCPCQVRAYDDDDHFVHGLRTGAQGYLLQDTAHKALFVPIRAATLTESPLPSAGVESCSRAARTAFRPHGDAVPAGTGGAGFPIPACGRQEDHPPRREHRAQGQRARHQQPEQAGRALACQAVAVAVRTASSRWRRWQQILDRG